MLVPDFGPAYPRFVARRGPVWRWWRVPGWLRRLAELGAVPSDSEELRLRKAVLTLSSTMMASLACVWVVTYAVLGLWVSAAIPFGYQLATADRKSTRLNSSHLGISYAVFCL